MSLKSKNYINEDLLNGLLSFNNEKEKIEFETEVIQLDYMSYIEKLMDEMNLSKTDLAKKMKHSSSFISQLFLKLNQII
jgi:ribosome-binding protein aMBF1 (putative translation factor)